MKNIWETDKLLHCAIAGFCLSQAEQATFLKKAGVQKAGQPDGMEWHHAVIGLFRHESTVAKLIQKKLTRKFRKEIVAARTLSSEMWLKGSTEYLTWQRFGAYIWISAAHMNLSKVQTNQVFNNIHLFGHEMFFHFEQTARDLEVSRTRYQGLKEKYENIRRTGKKMEKDNEKLRQQIHRLQCRLEDSSRSKAEPAASMAPDGNGEEEKASRVHRRQDQLIASLRSRNKRLERQLEETRAFSVDLHRDFQSLLELLDQQNGDCRECAEIDLCSKRVLIVGGMSKLKMYYQQIVNKLGGQFKHHDGACGAGPARLLDLVDWSDFVLCPVDVNSHAACLEVKKTCKKTGKKFYMLKKSSLSSIYKTLVAVADA